ncbi:MAG: hypothetical protein MUO40_09060, partial [Anaerolineaceae bacterium]|nr:hypothetical protein [Anaerolineaceae bacterium]
MKKLFTLISFLAFFSLIFIGCQSNEDITSPVGSLVKPKPVYIFGCDPRQISDETVDLIAGQHNPVGTATFHLTGSGLEITYQLDADEIAAGAVITEVHIDFAMVLNNDANNGGFHANSSGNPSPGLFDINTLPSSGATSWSLSVSNADLLTYLNLPSTATVPDDFYIAAHGVVEWGGEGICPTLPDGKWRYLPSIWGINFYIPNVSLYDENSVNSNLYLSGLNGWCMDRDRGAFDNSWYESLVKVNFLCTVGEDLECYVDIPENINAVNWLLNNKTFVTGATMADIQVAIWRLIDDLGYSKPTSLPFNEARVTALVTEALNNNDFTPSCGQIIGVIMYEDGFDCTSTTFMQVMMIERTVECGGSETMWGF